MKVSQELSLSFWKRMDNNSASGKATIMLRIRIKGHLPDGFSLGYQVDPEKFDTKAAIVSGKSSEITEINKHLLFVRSELIRHYNLLKEQDPVVTPNMLKNAFLGIGKEQKTILQVADFHYQKFEEKVKNKKRADGTLKKWETTRDKIAAFIKHEFKLSDLPLQRIEATFAEDFFDFLTIKQKLKDNTAMKYIKNTRQLLRLAVSRKWMITNPIENFICSYIDPDRDILSADELSALYHKKFTIPRLAEARDAYVFMALTGYAYKDVLQLEPDNISKFFDGEDWIIKNRHKTWCRENVPLLPIAKAIIEKYKDHPYCVAHGRLLPIKSNQRFNGYLKEIADLCEIKKNLTTHTARHTFATTVTLANGVPLETVSAMLGHKSIRTTQIYAKIVATKISKDMKPVLQNFKLELPASLFTQAAA